MSIDVTQFDPARLEGLGVAQLREVAAALLERVGRDAQEISWRDARIDKLTFEIAQLRRLRYGAKSEQLDPGQKLLFDEAVEGDIAAIEAQLEQLKGSVPAGEGNSRRPRRAALPAHLPRRDVHHEPETTGCACGQAMTRIGEDVSEKLDYAPGVFTVERHVRGKWACSHCRTLVQAPVPAQIIDKGIPTAGLLAQVAVAKHNDHRMPRTRHPP